MAELCLSVALYLYVPDQCLTVCVCMCLRALSLCAGQIAACLHNNGANGGGDGDQSAHSGRPLVMQAASVHLISPTAAHRCLLLLCLHCCWCCHRCAPLRLSSIESELLLCFTPLVEPQNQCTNDASQCPCSEVNQDIAILDEYSLLQRKDLISLVKELYTNVKGTTIPPNLWVGAIAPPMNQQKQGWRWINGGLISEKDIDQSPRMRDLEQDVQCLSLSTNTGRYEVKDCSEKLPTLCTER